MKGGMLYQLVNCDVVISSGGSVIIEGHSSSLNF